MFDCTDGRTVIYTSSARFRRLDLNARFRRDYVSIAQLENGYIADLREYGGPLARVDEGR